jgi:diguanylate cyclase (GGDEF)-like protein/PAS domain S-box-containing protein
LPRVRAPARENASRGWSGTFAPDLRPGRFFEGDGAGRRAWAFVAGVVLPFALLPFADISGTDPRVLFATALAAVLILVALAGLPWTRLPAWTQAVTVLAYFVVIGLLRDASEGHSSIFDPLVALPVGWFAIYGTGRQLGLSVVAMGLTLTLPVVIGGPHTDTGDQFLRAVFAVALAAAVGAAVHLVVQALRRARLESRSILETSQEAFISIDEDGLIREWNPQAERLFGWGRDEIVGRPVHHTIIPRRHRDAHLRGLARFLSSGKQPMMARRLEVEGLRRDGTEVSIELSISALREGDEWRFHAFVRDNSERQATEAALREAEERFRKAFDDSRVGMALVSLDGSFQRVNRALSQICGRPENDLLGQRFGEIIYAPDRERDVEALRDVADGESYGHRGETRCGHARGHPVWVSLTVSPIYNSQGILSYLIAQMEDISERKESEERLTRQALHDSLTGLPNRTLFADRVRMATARRTSQGFAIIYLDLDGFKLVNDTLGHAAGDQVLIEAARRLERLLRAGDTLARLGGDEFALLCEGVGETEAKTIADRVIASLTHPIVVQDREIVQAASIGISLYGPGVSVEEPDEMLGEADMAMYRAKAAGKSRYALFESWMREGDTDRATLERELRAALTGDEIVVHYQPEVDLITGAITGAEALVRWRHPERGLLEPAQFLFVAETSDLIADLDDLVLREACRQAAIWRAEMPQGERFTVSVNISERRLADPDLSAKIAQAIADTRLPADSLCLEINERAMMDRRAAALRAIPNLQELGIRLLIDDFGVAISSFGSLKRLPRLNAIKIDASFIAGLGRSPEDSAGVAAIIGLAHGLKLTATAEGIERDEQLRELQALHCDRGQGYYFARPQPPETLAGVLRSARLGELIA